MTINGDLEVAGVIDSINVTQTNLLVENKEIYLAYNSNAVPTTDGLGNNKAGFVVAGLPDGIIQKGAASNEDFFGKSLLWNNNNGMQNNLGSSAVGSSSLESFWELKGGAFRITQPTHIVMDGTGTNVSSASNISFQMRINGNNELEFVKVVNTVVDGVASTPSFMTVARFGRQLTM